MNAQRQSRADHRLERCNLRLPNQVILAIDETRAKRPGFVSRNSWIAEAIRDKLKQNGVDLPPDVWSANDA